VHHFFGFAPVEMTEKPDLKQHLTSRAFDADGFAAG
jgi:hypothetical protein